MTDTSTNISSKSYFSLAWSSQQTAAPKQQSSQKSQQLPPMVQKKAQAQIQNANPNRFMSFVNKIFKSPQPTHKAVVNQPNAQTQAVNKKIAAIQHIIQRNKAAYNMDAPKRKDTHLIGTGLSLYQDKSSSSIKSKAKISTPPTDLQNLQGRLDANQKLIDGKLKRVEMEIDKVSAKHENLVDKIATKGSVSDNTKASFNKVDLQLSALSEVRKGLERMKDLNGQLIASVKTYAQAPNGTKSFHAGVALLIAQDLGSVKIDSKARADVGLEIGSTLITTRPDKMGAAAADLINKL